MADFAPERTYADKGFASHANRTHLRDNHIKSAIMHRAVKNKPLSERQKNANRRISKIRYIVEQCFGTLKRLFKMGRASYMGTVKVNAVSCRTRSTIDPSMRRRTTSSGGNGPLGVERKTS